MYCQAQASFLAICQIGFKGVIQAGLVRTNTWLDTQAPGKKYHYPGQSGPVIYSTTLRANELDDIPTIRLDLRVPVKKYYYPVRNLTTIDGFSTTPAIESYSSRAPTETSGLSFMELSLS